MPANDTLPSYDQLLQRSDAPAGSCWGLFGADDQLGTINFLTPERVAAAARLVRRGAVFSLNLPLHLPDPPLFNRGAYRQTINRGRRPGRMGSDDYLDNFYLQASSQWDSLAHVGRGEHGFYNGVQPEQVTGEEGSRNGIDNWARRGIVGRGILLDVARHLAGSGYDPMSNHAITVAELEATAAAQGVAVEQGDLLLVRTGWLAAYLALDTSGREEVARDLRAPGLEGSHEMAGWLWDRRVAGVAADCPALEPWPWDPELPSLHILALCYLGMPIGELWSLEALADDCAGDKVYEFLLTSAPLHLRGGIGSPPNALAVK